MNRRFKTLTGAATGDDSNHAVDAHDVISFEVGHGRYGHFG